MNSVRNLAGAVVAAALLAACSSSPHSSPAAASHPAASAATRSPAAGASRSPAAGAPAATTPAGSTAAGPLTMKQAKATYARIVGPGNALANKLGDAASGTAPFGEFRSDALAYVSELRAEIGKLQAVQWPAQAQSRINALIKTTYPADIGCLHAVAAAGSTAAAQAVSNSNKDCQVADNSSIPTSL
jgi:hypothetical protein